MNDKRLEKVFSNIEECKKLIQEVLDEGKYNRELERYQADLIMLTYNNPIKE